MLLKGKPLQMVATKDIGFFEDQAFLHSEPYQNKVVSLARDELTFNPHGVDSDNFRIPPLNLHGIDEGYGSYVQVIL